MEYKKMQSTVFVRLNPGEEICSSVLDLAQKEGITLAKISGLGALDLFTAGVFDTKEKQFHGTTFRGAYEIVSLTGTITRKEERPYLHLHMSAGDENGKVKGGHLVSARVSAAAEIIVDIIDGEVGRKLDEEVGLNVFDFAQPYPGSEIA